MNPATELRPILEELEKAIDHMYSIGYGTEEIRIAMPYLIRTTITDVFGTSKARGPAQEYMGIKIQDHPHQEIVVFAPMGTMITDKSKTTIPI